MTDARHEIPQELGYSPRRRRGYAMYNVTHSDPVARVIKTFEARPESHFISPDLKTNPVHNGVVKTGGTLLGPHFTLQYGADVSRFPHGEELVEWQKITNSEKFSIDCTQGLDLAEDAALKITGVHVFRTPAKDDYPAYCCVVLKIKPTDNLMALRRILYETLPSFDSYPEYNPHVTVGYFKPEFVDDIVAALASAVGQHVTITGPLALDLQ
jgi:2'-5' RNA ligase